MTYTYLITFSDNSQIFGQDFPSEQLASEQLVEMLKRFEPDDLEIYGVGRTELSSDGDRMIWLIDTDLKPVGISAEPWVPDFANLEDGFECLTMQHGKWLHVKWCGGDRNRFIAGYGGSFVVHDCDRNWAPLPGGQPTDSEFFDWR